MLSDAGDHLLLRGFAGKRSISQAHASIAPQMTNAATLQSQTKQTRLRILKESLKTGLLP
jgi:hypothetical protein